MSALRAPTKFIEFDEKGRAVIGGTTYRVIQIALDHLADGWSPQEISSQHYGRLNLAQVHAALSYYFENQAEFDAEIEQQVRNYQALRLKAGESLFVRRMRESGRLPVA
jgi:uncharacterized protein (DUF433 family)